MSQFALPKSQYAGYTLPLPISREQDAVQKLLQEVESQRTAATQDSPSSGDEDFVEFALSDFSVYLPQNRHHTFEMRPLNHLSSKLKANEFLFDGILSVGKTRHYVQGVPFNVCSIGNYGEEQHTVGDNIWIQSHHNARKEIYYRLGAPAPDYVRFHTEFKWLADLSKHFMDFCHIFEKNEVSVFDFRTKFAQRIDKLTRAPLISSLGVKNTERKTSGRLLLQISSFCEKKPLESIQN